MERGPVGRGEETMTTWLFIMNTVAALHLCIFLHCTLFNVTYSKMLKPPQLTCTLNYLVIWKLNYAFVMDQNEKVEIIWHTLFWKEWLGFLFSLECSSNRSFLCQQDSLSVFYQSNLTNVVSTDVFQYLGITLFSCPDHISASNDFFFFSKYNKSFFGAESILCQWARCLSWQTGKCKSKGNNATVWLSKK